MSNNSITIDNMLSSITSLLSSNEADKEMLEPDVEYDENENDLKSDDDDDDNEYVSDIDNDDDNDDDDDDDDPVDSQLFTQKLRKDYITQYYPDLKEISNEELQTLTKIVRNGDGIIVDPLHKTFPFITKFEKTRIIGLRTIQLENNAKPYIDVSPDIIDSTVIAEMELKEKKIPFIICRPLPNGTREFWKLEDLEYIETI